MHVSVLEVLMSLLAVMKSYECVDGSNNKPTNTDVLLVHQKTKHDILQTQPSGPCCYTVALIIISLLQESSSKLCCFT